MRQLLHVFYPAFIMTLSCKGRSIDSIAGAPDLRYFLDRVWAGEIDLSNVETKIEYVKAHMSQALQNSRTPRFQEVLQIVSATR